VDVTTKARRLCVLFAAAALILSWVLPASAADPADNEATALAELRTILKVPRPKNREEAMKTYGALLPKLDALADKYPKTTTGARALVLVIRLGMQLGETEKALAATGRFLKRYPDHSEVAGVEFLVAMLKYQLRDYETAKKLLTAHLNKHPDFRGKRQVQALLDKMKLIGSEAKDFTTKDLAGNTVKLSGLRGKIVLLDFFAGWCAPCVVEIPNLIKLYDKYHAQGFEIVGISLDRTAQEAKDYVKKDGLTWTVTWEEPGYWNNPVAKLYGIRSIPSMYLLDKQGKVLHTGLRGEALAKTLADLFPEKEK